MVGRGFSDLAISYREQDRMRQLLESLASMVMPHMAQGILEGLRQIGSLSIMCRPHGMKL